MSTVRTILCATVMAVLSGIAASQPAGSAASVVTDDAAVSRREAEERARIAAERSQKEAQTARAEVACYARFAVNDCLIAVRAERRVVLADLRRQEVSLNDAARKRRAAQQLLRVDERTRSAPP